MGYILDSKALREELERELSERSEGGLADAMAAALLTVVRHLAQSTGRAVDELDERLKGADEFGGELGTLRNLHVETNDRISALDERVHSIEAKHEQHDGHDAELRSLRQLLVESNQRASALEDRCRAADGQNEAYEKRFTALEGRIDKFIGKAQEVLEERIAEVQERRTAADRAETEGEKRLLAMEDRLRAAETKTGLRYRGVYRSGEEYQRGDFTTYAGGMWHADKDTRNSPGDKSVRDWTLAVKSRA